MPTSAAASRTHSARESFAASVRAQEWIIKKKEREGKKARSLAVMVLFWWMCSAVMTAQKDREEGTLDGGDEKPFPQPCFGTTCQSMKRQSWRRGKGGLELWGFCGVSDHRSGGACMLPPPPYSQLCDMEGVAGRQMSRDLWLKAVDVAAVAEQVSIQWITAVSLFII